jgi:hypothetical protein
MSSFSAIDLKRWIDAKGHLFEPPHRINHMHAHDREFIVMMLRRPNARALDFHIPSGGELLYPIKGDIELHFKPEGAPRRALAIREGELSTDLRLFSVKQRRAT